MFLEKEDLTNITDTEITIRMQQVADQCEQAEQELRLLNDEWNLLCDVETERKLKKFGLSKNIYGK